MRTHLIILVRAAAASGVAFAGLTMYVADTRIAKHEGVTASSGASFTASVKATKLVSGRSTTIKSGRKADCTRIMMLTGIGRRQ